MPDPVRETLNARATALRHRRETLEAHLRNADRELPADSSDRAQVVQGDEVYEALEASSRREMEAVERAIVRLDSGEVPSCDACGEPLDERRLIAMPTATLCVSCAT